jgi:hypothetical protein
LEKVRIEMAPKEALRVVYVNININNLEEGEEMVSGDDDIRFQLGAGDEVLRQVRSKQVLCDFCSAGKVVARFRCKDFVAFEANEFVHASKGDWGACETCCDLVVTRDRAGLTERSYEALIYQHPEVTYLHGESRRQLRRMLRELHEKFFLNLLSTSPNPV